MDTGDTPAGSVLTENPGELRFLLAGTARSGTTLVQRLACELPGVWVPQETHFWSHATDLADEFDWPVKGDDRHAIAEDLAGRLAGGVLPVDPLALARAFMSRHRRIGLWTVFESLVDVLSPDDRRVLGEKTPEHLSWWEPIANAVPALKLVAVARHPVEVLRSHRGVDWGERNPHALAERWVAHQRIALDALRLHGPDRVLIIRYEDVLDDPQAEQRRLAAFLGIEARPEPLAAATIKAHPLFAPHEEWRAGALKKIARRKSLLHRVPAADRAVVESACGTLMTELGYEAKVSDTRGTAGPPEGESLERVLAFRRWHAGVATQTDLPIY